MSQSNVNPGASPRAVRAAPRRLAGALALTALLVMGTFAAPGGAQQRGPQSVADLAEELQDTVVNISTSQTMAGAREGVPPPEVPKGSPFEEFFEDFFNRQQQGTPRRVSSLGSGFVIDPSGLIVTNNHVIEAADEIVVNFSDGRKLTVAEVLGRDQKTDLALLRVEPEGPLKAVEFGDSARLRVGDWVMAIGNPFGLGGSVTLGIISALKRDINAGPYDEFLQTDAAINRGNSGGPLFDMDGKVIGVNTAIISPTGGSIGIGFAIPASTATVVIDQLREFGETRRGWLGVRIQTVTDEIAASLGMGEPRGALVSGVTAGGPAEAAGIEAGDVIVGFAGEAVPSMRLLPRIVARAPIGEPAEVSLLRKGEAMSVQVTVGRLPEGDEVTPAAVTPAVPEPQPQPQPREESMVLGLSLSPMTDELRARYSLGGAVEGVVVTQVGSGTVAAERGLKAGDVIIEVTHEKVNSPEDVSKRIEEVTASGRPSVLLFVTDSNGEVRYVALPVKG